MPELPEVQTTVDELKKEILGIGFLDFWCDWKKSVKNLSPDEFKKKIKGEKILNISRRAKLLVFKLTNNKLLLAHQKMTGHFLVGTWNYHPRAKRKWQSTDIGHLQDKVNDYIHLMFWLDDGRQLAFSDLRKFGWIAFYENIALEDIPEISFLGPEPLDKNFTPNIFEKRLKKTSRPIKQAIMDPKIVVGIGNIYADESLFLAQIHPLAPANRIPKQNIRKLLYAIQKTLKTAIKHKGTTILSGAEEYRLPSGERGNYQDQTQVYHRENQPCPRCGSKIKRIKIGQRSAHFCPKCQKSV
ncbi:MAG: bifunctional DNA-formamidopyrimidine glycosylase/DNA-(apurinic or apyrimidinic site) lyase [Candidatus Paceibacterota bacterium]|jgi:formamidopyrimidine-DNA glycosylase